jgi:hypothetical protein
VFAHTVDQRKDHGSHEQKRKQGVSSTGQTGSVEIWIHASGSTPDELDTEEQPGVAERYESEGGRSSVSAEQERRDDQDHD